GPSPREFQLVGIHYQPLDSIRSAVANTELYRPIVPDDPEIQALVDSIMLHGVQEPLVLRLDDYLLSGHRRRAACELPGLEEVPCRRVNVRSTDPNFLQLLREFNRQRIKSIDEVLREEVLAANPEDAYQALVAQRKARARVAPEAFPII